MTSAFLGQNMVKSAFILNCYISTENNGRVILAHRLKSYKVVLID